MEFLAFDDPVRLFTAMKEDIRKAEKYIYLQTYKFSGDVIGQSFRDELVKKAREGVEVKLLIDSWGAGVSESFFAELTRAGGEVKFFRKIKLSLDVFSANHRRNHRKLLLIDSKITFIGSANITGYSLNWREFSVKITGRIAEKFNRIFEDDYLISNKIYQNKKISTRLIRFEDFEIIRDVPGNLRQPVKKKMLSIIRKANTKIIIETPYFLPGRLLRKKLIEASKRGVEVVLLTPLNSDVKLFDILRDRYFGKYFRNNIKILQYVPSVLHSKVIQVDDSEFVFGSSNFDYRSFRFMHEINLAGKNDILANIIKNHLQKTMNECQEFDYYKWKHRHFFLKIVERFLMPFRHLFVLFVIYATIF